MKDIYNTIWKTEEDLTLILILEGSQAYNAGSAAVYNIKGAAAGKMDLDEIIENEAFACIEKKQSAIKRFDELSGILVYFMFIKEDNRSIKSIGGRVVKYLDSPSKTWLILDITDETNWKINIYNDGSALTEGMGEKSVESLLGSAAVYRTISGKNIYSVPIAP